MFTEPATPWPGVAGLAHDWLPRNPGNGPRGSVTIQRPTGPSGTFLVNWGFR